MLKREDIESSSATLNERKSLTLQTQRYSFDPAVSMAFRASRGKL